MSSETTGSPDLDKQKGGIGRIGNTQKSRNEKQHGIEDISKVDRQEGEMNNGELGAGLEEEKTNPTTKK